MVEDALTPVPATNPPAPYLGGERNRSRRLSALLASSPHRVYVGPFVGIDGVFLRRTVRTPVEVINDLGGDVATLYRVLQRHYPYFVDMLPWRVASRDEFTRLVRVDPTTLTDLERTARILYLQRTAFGGKVTGGNFGVDRRASKRFDITKPGPILANLHERLAGVVVEQLPYANVIRRYDGPVSCSVSIRECGGDRSEKADGSKLPDCRRKGAVACIADAQRPRQIRTDGTEP